MTGTPNRSGVIRLETVRTWLLPRYLRLGRVTAIGVASGIVAGILVGGIGSRIAMRITALVGGDAIAGVVTENGNVVGQITAGGTIGLLFFGGVFTGWIGGLLYMAVRRWLVQFGPWKGLVFGLLLLTVFGSLIIESDNDDFARFGPPLLNMGMFAMLFLLFGLAVAPLADRLDRFLPAPSERPRPPTIAYALLAPLAVLPLVLFLGVLAAREPTALLLLVFGLTLVPSVVATWPLGSLLFWRRATTVLRLVLVTLPLAVGLARNVGEVLDILRAA